MPITSITTDPEQLTMTLVGDYPVPVERLWDAWVDPRQIERFWGPPEWPATFTRHDMCEGGRSDYYMTGPDGERSAGYWFITAIEPGRSFEVVDGFAGPDDEPNDDMPSMTMRFSFESTETGSRYVSVTTFPSLEAMEQLTEMGMVEGSRAAMGQVDAVVSDLASFAAGRGVDQQLIGDRQVRMTRVIRGTVEQVWHAHRDADLMQRWMLGPDGWTMPVCEVATDVGDRFRWEWEQANGEHRFGFEGELLESMPPHRAVTTERPIDLDVPPNRNEMTLTATSGGTLLSLLITCATTDVRDELLATGMIDGMETTYTRLEGLLVEV